MAANLIISLTQKEITAPYKFKTTGINVFSLEEAIYHCYRYWRESVDDFLSDELIGWVSDTLGLSLIASKIKEIAKIGSFSGAFLSFLSMTDYLGGQDFSLLKKELAAWDKRLDWERLKERADYLTNSGEYKKAFALYRKALDYSENFALLNNAGITLLKQSRFGEAAICFERAVKLAPSNANLILNFIEALVLDGQFDKADELIKRAETFGEMSELHYFKGEISFYLGNYFSSVPHYERAIAIKDDPVYIYRLCDVFMKLRQYDKALEMLETVAVKDKHYLKKQADIYAAYNNIPAAVKCMEKALLSERRSVDLWVRLARYHRLDYDLSRANSAIGMALSLAPDNSVAKLELARIRKAQGRTKEYQAALNGILKAFKQDYRENPNGD